MSYEEEDACKSYDEEEDTCMSYEEEDTCMSYEEEGGDRSQVCEDAASAGKEDATSIFPIKNPPKK